MNGDERSALALSLTAPQPRPRDLARLEREFALRDELESAWALRPTALLGAPDPPTLVFEDPGGEPLERLLGAPFELGMFLELAIALAGALRHVHERGLVHQDLKPANMLVDSATRRAWLMGFGIASRVAREAASPEESPFHADALPYMAPEQTGRVNRSIDFRSDLYSLGITFYAMLTGSLPFTASNPLEWVHAQVARLPTPPGERVKDLPAPIAAIVMKLLSKAAEERYQTAIALERDLGYCRSAWQTLGRIEPFELGRHDVPPRTLVPQALCGRTRELAALVSAFERVAEHGTPQVVLVSGPAGVGKSALVDALRSAALGRGLFAAGKFDQYQRDTPYATLARAVQGLVRQLLGQDEPTLRGWREALLHAVGPNGRLLVNLVPELEFIIGEQPPVAELPPTEEKARFRLFLRRFLGVFTRPKQPLVLFFDDLQWLDGASLELVEDLLTQPEVHHLLLVGAFRENDVEPDHALLRTLANISQSEVKVERLFLDGLGQDDVRQLVADALHCAPASAAPLAARVRAKTAGNPLFALQYIAALVDEGLVRFDHAAGSWCWDLAAIEAKGHADNVGELLLGKLRRLPPATRDALELLACLGNGASVELFARVRECSTETLHADLWEARLAELVARDDSAYRFVHDRVREAVYSSLEAARRPQLHLRVGRLLAAGLTEAERVTQCFELVAQFDAALELMTAREERDAVAELYLSAGRRAQASAAYAAAVRYFASARALLGDEGWERRRQAMFELELARGECELLAGDVDAADQHLAALACRTESARERARVACLRMELFLTRDRVDQAIAACLEYLNTQGITWSMRPSEQEASSEYEQVWSKLGGRDVAALLELPTMSDEAWLATMDVLASALTPALMADPNLLCMIASRMTNLSLEHGNGDASCVGYLWFGMLARTRFGRHDAGFAFGRLGVDLVERKNLRRFAGRTYTAYVQFVPLWTEHPRVCCDIARRAFEATSARGDITFATFSLDSLSHSLLSAGTPLPEVETQAEASLAYAKAARFGYMVAVLTSRLGLIRTLRGSTKTFGRFDYDAFDEHAFEQHLANRPDLFISDCWHHVAKLQARFHAHDYRTALRSLERADRLLARLPPVFIETAESNFYGALCHAALADRADAAEREQHLAALVTRQRQHQEWARHGPETFENRAALLEAELARLEGRELDAERCYERAVRSARANGLVHTQGVASELAARFHAGRGLDTLARAYLKEARLCYVRWGAEGKVRQLDSLHPWLREGEAAHAAAVTITSWVEQLDFTTALKLSQAVSGEMMRERLVDTLMRLALEHAGADRAVLLLSNGSGLYPEAEAFESGGKVVVRRPAPPEAALPYSVIHYVSRTRALVIVDDASVDPAHAGDVYVRERHVRSFLCLPLVNESKPSGVLYLENKLTPHVFTPSRSAVLQLLALQAAISLENSRLYADLAAREAKIRRLVDANIIGIVLWDLDGRIMESNNAFLELLGYTRGDVASGQLRWTELTPPEWRAVDAQQAANLVATGVAAPYEKEFFKRDGSRVPVLLGGALFDGQTAEGVAFVVDLTDRKRAEQAARENERRLREVQTELEHANRIASVGELSTSIAHEVLQPITGTITNAQVMLRALGAVPPNLELLRTGANRILRDAKRAEAVVGRVRTLSKKTPPRKEELDINDAILEVLGLTQGEARRHGVSVQTALAANLPPVFGDRVQLQQVMLNLIINAIDAMKGVQAGARDLLITTARRNGKFLHAAVQDSGPGLDPASASQIFEPFFSTKPSGLGMGLSICRAIIDGHGGELWASGGPRGAVFQFTVPHRAGASDGTS